MHHAAIMRQQVMISSGPVPNPELQALGVRLSRVAKPVIKIDWSQILAKVNMPNSLHIAAREGVRLVKLQEIQMLIVAVRPRVAQDRDTE